MVILVQIWLCFLCFDDSISFEPLKFLIVCRLNFLEEAADAFSCINDDSSRINDDSSCVNDGSSCRNDNSYNVEEVSTSIVDPLEVEALIKF